MRRRSRLSTSTNIQKHALKVEICRKWGSQGAAGVRTVNNIHYFLIKNSASCLKHTHIAKHDLAPKLCLWTFINLTFCVVRQFISKFYAKEWQTLTEKLAIGGCVSLFLDNAITGSKYLKPADICRICAGYLYPFKFFFTISGVLGDLINYHSLRSLYNTQYCAIFMERR